MYVYLHPGGPSFLEAVKKEHGLWIEILVIGYLTLVWDLTSVCAHKLALRHVKGY